MALKGKEWFYGRCLEELGKWSKISYLCKDLLDKGVGRADKARSHVHQSIGACQNFLRAHRHHIPTIQAAPPTESLDRDDYDAIFVDWINWFANRAGTYGKGDYGYNYDTLRGHLTRRLGGTRRGGGGGGDEFKKVLRVLAEFDFL